LIVKLTKEVAVAKFLFVTDLDNTLVGDDQALVELNDRLHQHRQQYGTKIVYATGRSPILYQQLQAEKNLLEPDALILAVGTEIYINGNDSFDPTWAEKLSEGWDRNLVLSITDKFPQLQLQPNSEQRPFKVSFFLTQEAAVFVLPLLKSELLQSGLNIKLIYSSGIDLDIVPDRSDKGQAVQFLRQKWQFVAQKTVVCGDSGNDIALFATGSNEQRGIIVGNARPELLEWHARHPADHRYLAKNFYAGGILEGLQYFGLIE
jgi:sucrose-6F-phosphate phosphohydrolase